MILLVEPISRQISLYVPAHPLPLMEIGSFASRNRPEIDIRIVSIPMDYGLPLTKSGKEKIYEKFLKDSVGSAPKGIGISCTAIAQAEEVIVLCERIKALDSSIFTFIGGYFPTLYYDDIFARTSSVDCIVIGEGEESALELMVRLEQGKNPLSDDIPNLAWQKNGKIHLTRKSPRFDLSKKAMTNLDLLRDPKAYEVLPYAFSRGCPYKCDFCMDEFIRPVRLPVPKEIILKDLERLSHQSNARVLGVSDALFRSFDLLPLLRPLGMKINFETRCDVFEPTLLPEIADIIGFMALGFESASFETLMRMKKIRDRSHFDSYISNAKTIFREAVRNEIPILVFLIAGYPGDTVRDLEASLRFAEDLASIEGPGGHVFKIGECRAYPKTKIYQTARSLPGVVFDDDGVFGQNIVRRPSIDLDFDTVRSYIAKIFKLSNHTPKLQHALMSIMPFFRFPAKAYNDIIIPNECFKDNNPHVLSVHRDSLAAFRGIVPKLAKKYKNDMAGIRTTRDLPI